MNDTDTRNEGKSDAYETRYCAFVDILGFTSVIADLEKGSITFDYLREVLSSVHEPPPSFFAIHEGHDLRAQSISDAVCLSASCTASGLSHLFFSLELLTVELLKKGIFLRGGIVRGNLFHDDRMVFGSALVQAYRIESMIARFPRIMIASDVRNDAAHYQQNDGAIGPMLEYIREADDGPYYLHALRLMSFAIKAKDADVAAYNAIAVQIQSRFIAAVDNPHHFEKVQWFARYWNDVVLDGSQGVRLIKGPGLGILNDPMDEA
jgi:hypothetical protein